MPSRVKFFLSLACLAAAAGGYLLMVHLGQTAPSYAVTECTMTCSRLTPAR